ncbi:MAG: glycosyl hydrolase family 28-related protein [Thermaerobacter sp.]|nr:glycosyl hydrolase family 28-related protein [Thermaerobacter sp.]
MRLGKGTRTSTRIWSIVVVMALGGIVVVGTGVRIPYPIAENSRPQKSAAGQGQVVTVQPAVTSPTSHPPVFNVVNYGADPSGVRDSTNAIRRAIAAAESHPYSEVYFPPGRFLLDQRSPHLFDFVIDRPIHIVGAGPHATTIINKIGRKTPGVSLSTVIFEIVAAHGMHTGGGSGSSISDMTLNSAMYDAGTDIMDFGSYTSLTNLIVLAARSTHQYNRNSFGIRVITVCNPANYSYVYRMDNVIRNVTIVGSGSGGNTELDLSCQVGTTASHISIHGNGMDIFYSRDIHVSHADLTGGLHGNTQDFTWVVTGSSHVALSHITTDGQGGVIEPDPVLVSHQIQIAQERMIDRAAFMRIGDVQQLAVTHSTLGNIAIDPVFSVTHVTMLDTTYGRIWCRRGTKISGLSGLRCPTS